MVSLVAAPEHRGIASDQRGFVLLMGIAMGSVLAISLWYLMSVGDAILVRERMQDAADAVALDTATWHARGMNAVAMINMVMALAFTVMIAIRMAELVVAGLLIICHVVTALLPPAEAACGTLDAAALVDMLEIEMSVGGRILQGIQIANWVQAGVAIITPIEAVTVGVSDSESAYTRDGRIAGVSAISLSVVPTGIEAAAGAAQSGRFPTTLIAELGTRLSFDPKVLSDNPLLKSSSLSDIGLAAGAIPSLPIQADGYESLCSRSGEVLATALQLDTIIKVLFLDKVRDALGDIDIVGPIVKRIIPSNLGGITHDASRLVSLAAANLLGTKTGATIFCKPVLDVIGDAAENAADAVDGGHDVLDQKAGGDEEARKSHGVAGWLKNKIMSFFGSAAKNLRKLAREAKDHARKLTEGLAAAKGPSIDDIKTAKLWEFADNGNPFMHTWATATGTPGPENNAWFQSDRDPVTAEGEFYSNCFDAKWSTGFGSAVDDMLSVSRDCREDLMWRLAWTGRLRRYREPRSEIRQGLQDTVLKLFDDGVSTINGALADDWKGRPENKNKSVLSNPYERDKWLMEGKGLPFDHAIPGINQLRDDALAHMHSKEKHQYAPSLVIH